MQSPDKRANRSINKGKTLLYPQEIEVFYIIPALKRRLAIELKNSGFRQTQIAKIFHVKEASISQYLSSKRGSLVQFNPHVIQNIKNSAAKINSPIALLSEIQKLLIIVRNSGELCRIHKQLSPIPMCCSPRLINCFPIKNQKVPVKSLGLWDFRNTSCF